MTFDLLFGAEVLLVGRLLFGGVIAFAGVNHFLNTDLLEAEAREKGVPEPRTAILLSGALLIMGGLTIVTGAYPDVGSLMLILFFALATPAMHGFWRYEGEKREQEKAEFVENAALLGGAVTFLYLSGEAWGYGLGLGILPAL